MAQPPGFPKKFPPLPGKPPAIEKQTTDSNNESSRKTAAGDPLSQFANGTLDPKQLLQELQTNLQSDDTGQRMGALISLGQDTELDSELRSTIDNILNSSENPFERLLAATASLRDGKSSKNTGDLIEELSSTLQSEDPAMASQSAIALSQAGRQAEPAMLQLLQDANPQTRALAAEVLGKIDSPNAAPRLTELLQDKDRLVRAAAAKALPASGADANTALVRLLQSDPQLSVRAGAASSLTKSVDPTAHEAIVAAMLQQDETKSLAIIRSVAGSEASLETRAQLLGEALLDAKPAQASEIISHLVDMEQPGLQALVRGLDSNSARYWSVVALSEFGSDAAMAGDKLASLLATSSPDVKTEILLTLAKIKPKSEMVNAVITREMLAKENGVRYAATLAAVRLDLDGDSVQSNLRTNRENDDKVLSLVSAFALAKLNSRDPKQGLEAAKALRAAIASGDPRLKPLATSALAELQSSLPALPSLR